MSRRTRAAVAREDAVALGLDPDVVAARAAERGRALRAANLRPVPVAPDAARATKSGARAPRVYGALAERLVLGLIEERPDLERYPEAMAAWAQCEAQAALMRRHLEVEGWTDGDGEPRAGALHWLDVWEKRAIKHRASLGLDPRSEAELARNRVDAARGAVDLAEIARRGEMAAAERAGEPLHPDLPGQVLGEVLAASEDPVTRGMAERVAGVTR